MYLTGFADEAASLIELQIKAAKELGWGNIEMRSVGGRGMADLPDGDFDLVVRKLEKSGVKVNCFGSAIANWSKQITDPWKQTEEEVKVAIRRMKQLDAKMVRIMSYAVLKDREAEDQMKEERFRRVRDIRKMFEDAGILAVHENCMNYGGMSWKHTLELIENVPGLRLVYDTGNPIFTDDRAKPKPYPKQSSWEFYAKVKEHISYIHIKDGVWNEATQTCDYTFPGEGRGDVKRIVKDLLAGGYDGGFSIEPHMAVVYHEGMNATKEELKYQLYVEYGRRMEAMLRTVKK
ncbi:MAG TPA: sugar phosphate isomerase/epimerase family protein [Sedimentisphaerales bacterium]|nr:sugar phosphate isomerase/epimerase family protein [Sedimentisphaerales bacterium]